MFDNKCSLLDNIKFGCPDANLSQIEDVLIASSAYDFVMALPDERGIQLSGGQKQRIALARALLINPPIIILDEATSALDSESEYIQRAVHRICNKTKIGETNTTIISIAHVLSTMRAADSIALMHEGQIVETGTYQDLVDVDNSNGKLFQKLIKRQV
eukprot:GSMAST32.ASY1.ANO1.961.1 assembled CDS